MDYKKVFEKFDGESFFVKTTGRTVLDASQKAALNRKGNTAFNNGDIEGAKRIFITTGYSDGLVRIGDAYKAQGRLLDALKMYWQAPDKTKAEPIIMQLSRLLQDLMHEDKVVPHE
ncbi:MAG: hypothetical protein LBL64_08920 [Treponema sp.]|jgi:hypothetical protein|nr:hypothetical protein [Treponema sp.]